MSNWPPESNFPIGDPNWSSSGRRANPWGLSFSEFRTGFLPARSVSGGIGASPSTLNPTISTLYTEGYFNTGKLQFYWKVSSELNSGQAFSEGNYGQFNHIQKINNQDISNTILIIGGYNINTVTYQVGSNISPLNNFSYASGSGPYTLSYFNNNDRWSGLVSYNITGSGFHRFEWNYIRNRGIIGSRDGLWLAGVSLPDYLTANNILNITPSTSIPFLDIFNESPTFSGKIYYSKNTGRNFVQILSDRDWTSINISPDAKNIIATAHNNYLYRSFNTGVTFNFVTSLGIGSWNDCDLSDNGQCMTVAANNGLFVSINSGNNWTNRLPNTRVAAIAVSNNGQYQTALPDSGKIQTSNSSGSLFYTDAITPVPSKSWKDISMTNNGEIQIACTKNEYLWISRDFGNTWSSVFNDRPRNWSSVDIFSFNIIATEKGGNIYISPLLGDGWITYNIAKNWNFFRSSSNNFLGGASMDKIYNGSNLFETLSTSNLSSNFFYGNWIDGVLSENGQHQFVINKGLNDLQIKYKNLYFSSNQIANTSNIIYGFGNNNINSINSGTGLITNITGFAYQPAVLKNTGLLQGFIDSGSGSYNWEVNLQETGSPGNVFFDFIVQKKQASGVIEFINNTGSGLKNQDSIVITNPFNQIVTAFYVDNPNFVSIEERDFHSLQNLVDIINSHVSDLSSVILDNNKIYLFADQNLGSIGNQFKIARFVQDPMSIKIPYRYFVGGEDIRQPVISNWTGLFSILTGITKENSGFYNKNVSISDNFEILGIVWQNSLNTWRFGTGLRRQNDPLRNINYINYNENLNYFSGSTLIPKNQTYEPFSGFNIQINRNNPYRNQYTGQALYLIEILKENSLDVTKYSGILVG
jgi:photosystem II stability/assembly factor-like uncharacterized protein